MGYTHYWEVNPNITDQMWSRFCKVVRKITDIAPTKIVRESDRTDEPAEITDEMVAFNGPGDDGYETFCVERNVPGFGFCKTNRKPYDGVVVACCIAGAKTGVFTEWSSDGDIKEGFDKEAYELLQKAVAA